MPSPSLDFVKQWARIDGGEFDVLLPVLIDSATATASHETGRSYDVEDMPAPVQQYVAVMVAYWVNNPDAAESKAAPNPHLVRLLDPYLTY
jgi:hypothetical protein